MTAHGQHKPVTDASFTTDVLESDKPVLVDFWAEWCGPCKMVAPVLEEIANEHGDKLQVVKLNIDENPETARDYRIMSIPTMSVFEGGQVDKNIVGAKPKAACSGSSPSTSDRRTAASRSDIAPSGPRPTARPGPQVPAVSSMSRAGLRLPEDRAARPDPQPLAGTARTLPSRQDPLSVQPVPTRRPWARRGQLRSQLAEPRAPSAAGGP